MQEALYQTADARDSLSDSGSSSFYIKQRMQESPYQKADAVDFIKQDEGYYTRQDAGVSISDSECMKL